MTPKELIDKITLAAEQLEALRTEHNLPMQVLFDEGEIAIKTSNKKHVLEIYINNRAPSYGREADGRYYYYNTYEELVEACEVKTDEV